MTTIGSSTTGIGSLPHHNVDAALAFSFRMGIPFLPQIPIRNPWEYMIPQALEGLPGLQAERDGAVSLDFEIWKSRRENFSDRLSEAFAKSATERDAFEAFEPSAAISSCWQPFIWEASENELRAAKIQIAGPMTAQWVLKLSDGETIERHPELSTQIYRLILARALAMSRRLLEKGIQPLLYLDEPGLYALSPANPRHVLALQEMKLLVQALRKERVTVGMHCCSNTDWSAVLGLGIQVLSLDAELSLRGLLTRHGKQASEFIRSGGRLSLGVIPTARSSVLQSLNVQHLFAGVLDHFGEAWGSDPELVRLALSRAIYTPACGLALHSVADSETVLEALMEFHRFCASSIGPATGPVASA